MGPNFCVILTAPHLPPLMDLAKVYSSFRKLLVPDALPLLKPRSGLIEDKLNQEDAQKLSGLLTQAGLANAIVPSERIAVSLPAHSLAAVQLLGKGLSVSVQPDAWQSIPWNAFALLAVAVFKETTVRVTKIEQGPSAQEKLVKAGILLTTGIPLPMAKKKTIQTRSEETNLHYYLDLFLKKPEIRLRLDGHKLDYQFLGEKMTVGTQENFRTLLRELATHTPVAQQNTAFAHMSATPPQPLVYQESEKLFDQECRWLLTQQQVR